MNQNHSAKVANYCLLALMGISSPSLADFYDNDKSEKSTGIYLTGAGGFSSVGDAKTSAGVSGDVDTGFAGEIGFGYRMNQSFRAEVTYIYNNPIVQNIVQDGVANSFLINAYYDINNNGNWTPYIGAGIGSATISTDASTDKSDSATAWQAKLGVSYAINSETDFFGEVGYQSIGETNLNNIDIDSIDMIKGQIGLRFYF